MCCPVDVPAYLQALEEFASRHPSLQISVAAPATLIAEVARGGPSIMTGGQDCHPCHEGAFTGSISAPLLRRAGASFVLVGHSERRAAGDTDEVVRQKLQSARSAGLLPVLCVGETLEEREAGLASERIEAQICAALEGLAKWTSVIVAYEPVWAIGTGRVPTARQVEEAVAAVRAAICRSVGESHDATVLYGGSATADTVRLLRGIDLDGFLVGNASLFADKMGAILAAITRQTDASNV